MHTQLSRSFFIFMMSLAMLLAGSRAAIAQQSTLDMDAQAALKLLYDTSPTAKVLGQSAKGILVFPNVTKAGFIIGGQGGDGILIKNGTTAGYYTTSAVSVGMQAGAQSFGYVLFFMTDKVMQEFEQSKGWEIGVGPNIVVVDSGAAKNMSSLTAKADIYAFIFNQKGLMAGLGLQGSKITKLEKH